MNTRRARVLHVLWENRSLDTYPPVYNAVWQLKVAGIESVVAAPGELGGVADLVCRRVRLSGRFSHDTRLLVNIASEYDAIVVYLPRDLAMIGLCDLISQIRVPVFYHSIEIETRAYGGEKLTVRAKRGVRGLLHGLAYRKVHGVIIQDRGRHELLERTYGPIASPVCYVTNSIVPDVEPVASGVEWLDRCNDNRPIALYTGGIGPQTFSLETIREISRCSSWRIVVAGWGTPEYVSAAYDMINRLHIENVEIRGPIGTRGDLNYVVSRCTVGLCLYHPLDDNQRFMGMSSGKYHRFLHFGKPVMISGGLPGLSDFTAMQGFGAVCDSVMDIPRALADLDARRAEYIKAIITRYKNLCDFKREYATAVKWISTAIGRQ